MKYELRHFDKTLLTFDIFKHELGEYEYQIINVNNNTKHLLPIGLELSNTGIDKWLKTRIIPKNRQYVEQLLSKLGLSRNDTMGIINICKGLSLNDAYWVVEENFNGKFSNYNLYENNFTRVLALIAYTGYGSNTKKGFTSSPEFTTNGMLKKCWRRINGKIYLYKGGTSGASNTGNEPYSEYYSSQIARTMELNHIDYNPAKFKGTICSTCELFTSKEVSYVPIHNFLTKDSLVEASNFLKNLGDDFYNEFVDMLIFDALIYNTDRHFSNFGLLVDNNTNKPIRFAPIFDNGLSLFNYATEDDLNDLKEYSKTRLPIYDGVTFEEIVKLFSTERQIKKLCKMINFKFKKHSRYNLSNKRLKQIENFLQIRVQELIKISTNK